MGYINRAFSFLRRSLENPATKLSNPAQWLVDAFGGGPSDAGVPVTQQSAISLTAVWCAVRIISETLASVPLFVYERQEPRGRRKAVEHDLFDRLHLQPNPDMTSYEFRRVMQAVVLLHGNAYAFIRRDRAGRPKELWPLLTQTVEPKRTDKEGLIYVVRLNDGTTERFGSMDMLHIRGLGFDGVKGKSVIGACREGIGLGLAAQKYASIFFGRGGRVPGVLQTQWPQISEDKRKNISEGWYAGVGGADNWHKIAVLSKGVEYKQIGIPPEDSQFMELRKFQVNEVARMFNIQPHKLKDLDRATFSNIEQQNIEFVVDTMQPWFVNWEQEMRVKLQALDERKRLFIEFMIDGLLRGDSAARGAFYALGIQWGWLSQNDIRELENLPDIGPQGDVYKAPMNMINSKELMDPASGGSGGPQLPPTAAANARRLPAFAIRSLGFRRKLKEVQTPVIEARARVIIKRETEKIEKELQRLLSEGPRNRRDLTSLRKSIDEFYKEHAGWAADRMEPVIRNYAELISKDVAGELGNDPEAPMPPQLEKFVSDYSSRFGAREASEGRLQILALMQEGDEAQVAEAIRERLGEWSEKRPGKIAVAESTQFMAAAAKVVMVVAGVTLLRWVANADSCPFCSTMDGKVVGVEKDFVSAGEGVDAASGDKAPMKLSSNIGHPPLHSGCLCDIVREG